MADINYYYLYQAIWQAINLYVQYCLAEVPGCVQYYKNIVRSLFQNGRQFRAKELKLQFLNFRNVYNKIA